MFNRLLSRRWWKTTILVVIGLGLLIRLGIWQLDRLAQRRAFNARVEAQIGQPVLTLRGPNLKVDLKNMEYRQVEVTGTYDFAGQVVLRNQAWNDQMGVDLLTPLHIAGSDQSVLVDRGWIPYEDFASGALGKYTQPGTVTVTGVIRASETRPEIGWRTDPVPAPGEAALKAWNLANVSGIAQQLPYPLLPVYIQVTPVNGQSPDIALGMTTQQLASLKTPIPSQPVLDLSEGPHLGYAIQWFSFAVILGLGYPFYIRREEKRRNVGLLLNEQGNGI